MSAWPGADDDPVETYLDELLDALRGTAHDVRRTMAESEAHLRDATDRHVAAGVPREQASTQAVASFGSVREVAAAFNRAHRPAAVRALLPGLAWQAWLLTGTGLVAVGASGLLAWAWSRVAGLASTFADGPGTRYDPATCAHFLAVQRSTTSCAAAALLEGRDDALVQRSAAGVLGIVMLVALAWWTRRQGGARLRTDVSAGAAVVAVTAFCSVGVVLTGYGIDRAVVGRGAGQWLASGIVAGTVGLSWLIVLFRRVTTRTV